MNSSNAKDYLPLVQALAEGRVIQFRLEGENSWNDAPNLSFAYALDQYRIKPEPREIWVNRYPDGTESGGYPSKDVAFRGGGPGAIQVRYREVIE